VINNRLFYLIGASGSGKDTLMDYARQHLKESDILFAHRYITRPFSAGGENHIALTEKEFFKRRQGGLFALHWHSHGQYYGIGIEIDAWLERGFSVVVNGSRAYLQQALQHYPDLLPVWVRVSEDILQQRLLQRGRESDAQIQVRLKRAQQFQPPELKTLITVHNNGTIAHAGEELVALLQRKAVM
jgi:ribose 1,5-bisphosphokinase